MCCRASCVRTWPVAAGLTYFVPAGTRLGATSGGFELIDVTSLAALGPAEGRQRVVLATVQARDRVAQQELALRYRVRLVRSSRCRACRIPLCCWM